jgi:hypothetical protein
MRVFPAARVPCGVMPDHHEAPVPGVGTDPFMGTIVLVLIVLLGAVVTLAAGLTWKGLLHWTGELPLLLGISLAAKGISDVRREWTQLPGTWGSAKQKALRIRGRGASFLWLHWNRALERWPVLARRLRLRIHPTHCMLRTAPGAQGSKNVHSWHRHRAPASAADRRHDDERLAWLEESMAGAWTQLGGLHIRHEQYAVEATAMTGQEKAERTAEAQALRGQDGHSCRRRPEATGVGCRVPSGRHPYDRNLVTYPRRPPGDTRRSSASRSSSSLEGTCLTHERPAGYGRRGAVGLLAG